MKKLMYDYITSLNPPSLSPPPSLPQVQYYGLIKQSTGEDWINAKISLSTAQPSLGGAPPTLGTHTIRFKTPRYYPASNKTRSHLMFDDYDGTSYGAVRLGDYDLICGGGGDGDGGEVEKKRKSKRRESSGSPARAMEVETAEVGKHQRSRCSLRVCFCIPI